MRSIQHRFIKIIITKRREEKPPDLLTSLITSPLLACSSLPVVCLQPALKKIPIRTPVVSSEYCFLPEGSSRALGQLFFSVTELCASCMCIQSTFITLNWQILLRGRHLLLITTEHCVYEHITEGSC